MWPPLCGWGPPPTQQGCPGRSARLSPSTESCPPSASASQPLPPASRRPHTSPQSLTPTSVRTNQAQHMRYQPWIWALHHLYIKETNQADNLLIKIVVFTYLMGGFVLIWCSLLLLMSTLVMSLCRLAVFVSIDRQIAHQDYHAWSHWLCGFNGLKSPP